MALLTVALAMTPSWADVTWDGSESISWGNADNWLGGAPTSSDIGIFNSTVYTNQPSLDEDTVPSVLGLQLGGPSTAALTLSTTASADAGQITNGAVVSGSTTITLDDASGTFVGQRVTGNRIQGGTFVTNISGNTITLSRPTAGGTLNDNTQLTFYSSLQIGGSGVTVLAGTPAIQTLAAPTVLDGSQTWTNNSTLSQALTISTAANGGIYLGSHTLTLSGAAGSNTYMPNSHSLNGDGSLVIDTQGTVTIGNGGAVNTFSGGITLNSGTLVVSWGSSGGSGNAFHLGEGVLTINGGNLNGGGNIAGHPLAIPGQVWNNNFTFLASRSLNMGTGGVSLGTAAGTTRTITTNGSGTLFLTIGGVITDGTTANSINKAGTGKMVLAGINEYTGGTTVSAGTLEVTGTLGTGDVEVMTDAILTLGVNTAIDDAASLTLNEDALINLNFTEGNEIVTTLVINGTTFSTPMVFNADNNYHGYGDYFTSLGGGLEIVPEPASLALIVAGTLLMLPRKRTR